jgi:hypothetical protein
MSNFGIFHGPQILQVSTLLQQPIIDGYVYHRGFYYLIAKEKVGKSILGVQMLSCITTASPFLDAYPVPEALEVLYIQTEGNYRETQERLINMSKGIPLDPDKFTIIFEPSLALNTAHGLNYIVQALESAKRKPRVILIDPLYMAIEGSMSDAAVASAWVKNARVLQDKYDAAVIVIHHTHRQRFSDKGVKIEEGDDSIFGSFVWKANADAVLVLRHDKKDGTFTLSCDTQRGTNIITKTVFTRMGPVPLLYTMSDPDTTKKQLLINNLLLAHPNGLYIKDIENMIDCSKATVYRTIAIMEQARIVVRDERPEGALIKRTLANPMQTARQTPPQPLPQYNHDTAGPELVDDESSDSTDVVPLE